ncbi:MAG: sulfite exporter TauE/SafE family protein [Psychroflexus salarius]|jgi:uncharacterized membrane protein YfcA
MALSTFLLLVVIGVLGGFASGLLGLGGGIIMVPLMLIFLNYSQQQAQGTSLAILAVPVTFISAYNYYQDGEINWKYALIMALCFIVGGYFGSKLAITINQALLKKIFGVVMLIVGLKMIFGK